MQKFHKLISASSEGRDSYLQALKAFTKVSPPQLVAMTSASTLEMRMKTIEFPS